jgi:hypothetical protein
VDDLVSVLSGFGVPYVFDERVRPVPGPFAPVGIMVHDTVTIGSGLTVCKRGRVDLKGPLCQVLISRAGIVNVVTDGRANGSGAGVLAVRRLVQIDQPPFGDAAQRDSDDGNTWFYNIECDWYTGEGYPPMQIEALSHVCAALCGHHGWTHNRVIHHREWTKRKSDMHWTGDLRARVAARLYPPAPLPAPLEDDMRPRERGRGGGA